jgi:hypothetical protein
MKYLAFDLEIAFDFNHISTNLFPPEDGERVLLAQDAIKDSKTKDAWTEAEYVGGIIKRFRLPNDKLIKATCWKYQGNDWKRFRPLGITCAAATSSDGGLWNWCAQDASGRFTEKMVKQEAKNLVEILTALVFGGGYIPLTWNGLGFDFDVLSEESGMHEECKELALNHIDMMFHFFASKGYPLGLDAASKGMNLPGKPEGMDGAKAPELWPADPHRVMAYCSLDVKNTLGVAEAIDTAGRLNWISRSGNPNYWLCKKWLTVKEAMVMPSPDTSWMSDPWPRSKFYGWTGYEPYPQIVAGKHHKDADWDIDYDEMEEEERKEIE